jgi:phosphatidylglycerol lysyltransferase
MRRLLHTLLPFIGLAMFAVALAVLYKELRHTHWRDLIAQARAMSGGTILLAMGLCALDYLALTSYDTMAFHYIGRPLPWVRVAPASFVAYAMSHNLGFSVVSGGSIRYRYYGAWGFSGGEVARIIAFCVGSFWLAFLGLGGWALVTASPDAAANLSMPPLVLHIAGTVLMGVLALYVLAVLFVRGPLQLLRLNVTLPTPGLALCQVVASLCDWLLATSVIYVLLPPSVRPGFGEFVGIFMLAQITGLASNVPGGLGVFEIALLLLLGHEEKSGAIAASLIVYRMVYYIGPLVVAAGFICVHELRRHRERLGRAAQWAGDALPRIVPSVLALLTFIGGALLLFAGALPAEGSRLEWVNQFLPLAVMEMSHFLASLVGAALLILARGIQRRLDAAYYLALILLVVGSVASLLKGFDWDEALILALFAGLLAPCRPHFYRRASLTHLQFTPRWLALVGLVLVASAWLGIFSYKNKWYRSELWWQFALHEGDASRFQRAMVGSVSLVALFALYRLLRPVPPAPTPPTPAELDRAWEIARRNPSTTAHLALLGDKPLLFSENGRAFIMYGVEGRSWVAMGDPVGPAAEISELAWEFRELADLADGWSVFYQVRPENLPLYLDLGLSLVKVGEEARVALADFTLEGREYKALRHSTRNVERLSGVFEIVPAEGVPAILPELRAISEDWLARKHTREKRFSLGSFREEYLSRQPVAVVRVQGRIVAFANLLLTEGREELSLDLMRYASGAPNGTMEFLFARIMLWGREQGYAWFNLGMAPLSGLEARQMAPPLQRLGTFLYRHGEHFYNFQGLRAYKEKFNPVWEPRYLATPGGLALPRVIANLVALVAGGMRGAFLK